jgi:hypothetical protein
MHPLSAARLVAAFVKGRVLDPFCGSGTVLVEAMIAGRPAVGTDLNPLAVRLAQCKTRPRSPAELARLVQLAADCAAEADARRKAKAGASRRFPRADVELFEPHVLLELDSLRAAIESVRDDSARADLELVLSAILVKLSRKPGDTARRTAQRRTAGGFAARLFADKARELSERLAAFAQLLPKPPPHGAAVKPGSAGDRSRVPVTVLQDDATKLEKLPPGPVDAVITSPPYAATYDYLAHHELRLRWLGLDAGPLAKGEIGSRAAYSRLKPKEARAAWAKELERFLRAVAKVLPPGGPLVLLMADSAVGDTALRADEIVAEAARACGFAPTARASQPRPHFHGPTAKAFRQRARHEHALLLRKV